MKSPRLACECLERRDVPATFGNPWAVPDSLTISFAPDGASVDGFGSSLSQLATNSGLSEAVFRTEILRAFQTWANVANLNFAVVPDQGQAYGASGQIQSDHQFGDIRIFARPLSSNNLALANPPNEVAGTRGGDIILNSNKLFSTRGSGRNDLFTVMLQEAGHSLGVGNNANPSSAMYEYYQGPRKSISPADVTAIRSLYGVRLNWIGDASNDADRVTEIALPHQGSTLVTYGDIRVSNDVDFYQIKLPSTSPTQVRLETNDLSLLAAKVTILDSDGAEVATRSANASGQNLSLNLRPRRSGSEYTIRVERATNSPFENGKYRLLIGGEHDSQQQVRLYGVSIRDDSNRDDSISRAFTLDGISLGDNRKDADDIRHYRINAQLRDSNDRDFYRIRTPALSSHQIGELTISLRNFTSESLPSITVFAADGSVVPSRELIANDGLRTLRVANVTGNTRYFVRVGDGSSDESATYQLKIAFRPVVASLSLLQVGNLSVGSNATASLNLSQTTSLYLALTAANGASDDFVMLTIRDAAGTDVFSLITANGTVDSGYALLLPGLYSVLITGTGPIQFALGGASLSDPTGVLPIDPTLDPVGMPPTAPITMPIYTSPMIELPPATNPNPVLPIIDPMLLFPDPLLLLPYPVIMPPVVIPPIVITPEFMMMMMMISF